MAHAGVLDNNPQWQEVKKVVRSVLLTDVRQGIKLEKIALRYKELWQAPLDFGRFGFGSVLELFEAMPDVVRIETDNGGVTLHAKVDDMGSTYLTPALKRAVKKKHVNSKLEDNFDQLALSSDSESETVPRKRFQSSFPSAPNIFKSPGRRAHGSGEKSYFRRPIKQELNPDPVPVKTFRPVVKQEEETDPERKALANELQPNTRGYYAVLVPRNDTGITSMEVVEDVFKPFGELKEVSRTPRYYFIRYQYRHQAVSAVLATRERYGTRVPQERGNPKRLIKAKDIVNKPSCSRQMTSRSNMSLLSASSIKEGNLEDVEVFIGNINLMSTEVDVLRVFENYEIKKKRFVTKDHKRFAFFTVVGLDEAKKMCNELHKTVLDGRELIVQVSYVSTSESMPAIQPSIPEEDKFRFTNKPPQGTYQQLTNLDYEDDDSDNEDAHFFATRLPNPQRFQNRLSAAPRNNPRPSFPLNLPNLPTLEDVDDLPPLEDTLTVEVEPERKVVFTDSFEDSDMEYEVQYNPDVQALHVILEGFPHHTHFKQIYSEFRKVGIERLKVDIISNYKPNPTLAIVTFDCEESVQEALKWNGKDFNHQPMYIRRLDTNSKHDMEMLKIVLNVRNQMYGERTVSVSATRGMRGANHRNQGHETHRGGYRGGHGVGHRGRGHPGQHNDQGFYSQHKGQGDFLQHQTGPRGAPHIPSHPPSRHFLGRGGTRPPPPYHNRPPFEGSGAGGAPRFRNPTPMSGRRPLQRGMPYSRGRGRGFHSRQNQLPPQPKQAGDLFAPTEEDYSVSAQFQGMLDDCFPEGCKPWIAKDLPEMIEAHVSHIVNDKYFFAHVTNGLPGIEIKEMTRKMGEKEFSNGAEEYTDPNIRRCGAFYSDDPEQQPELFRAWIQEFLQDGQCEVFFIDWGNSSRQSCSDLKVIRDIYWTMRPQIVLFKMNDTNSLQKGVKLVFKVLTDNVYEKNFVVPVELADSE